VLDVVDGLEYLHSIPVAHGDLKGENVLVNVDGRASLCDFGMSQFVDDAHRITGFSTTNWNAGGTDRFMSPELLEDEPKTKATDMWALCCLIVFTLTDEVPYQRIKSRPVLPFAIFLGEKPVLERSPHIPEPLWQVIQRCWSKSPHERPAVFELRRDLVTLEVFSMASALWKLAIISPPLDLSLTRPRISFSPDGRYLAVVSTNGHVEIWKVERGAVTQLTKWSSVQAFVDNYITNVIWSPSQNHLLVTSNHSAELFDVKTGERVINLGPLTSASFLSDSAELAFIAMPGRVFFQNLRSRQASQYIVSLDEEVVDISIFPDNERIIGITMTELR
ncbi:hypothetical protein FRC02_007814, partial [Tulasnella sp. 418]